MYIDGTDLLHWDKSPDIEDEKLIKSIQRDVNVWEEIVQSTGGILKVIKCSLFLLACRCPNGRARLKTLNDLPYTPCEVVVETPEGEEDNTHVPFARQDTSAKWN